MSELPGAVGISRLSVYDTTAPDGLVGGTPHTHLTCSEGYVVVAGDGAVQTLSGEGYRETLLATGTVAWFPPGTIHRLVNRGGLQIVVVMQNSGLPEAGDAVLTLPPEVLAGAGVAVGPVRTAAPDPGARPVTGSAGSSPDESSLGRFSLNQATTKRWPMDATVAGCVEQGVHRIGLWRDQVADYGLARTAELIGAAGLSVTSLCRGGFFQADDWFDENRRAIDEAATLGASVLVLVSGGLPSGSRDLDGARRQVGEAIGRLVPHAVAAGVRLAIEPLHPMFAADRCVVATLGNALDLAAPFPANAVGVCVDTYHLWWDEQIWTQLARAGRTGRIACFQVADWIAPLPEGALLGRGLPGAGCIELRRFREAVDATGFTGPIEVEVFHTELWGRPGADVLKESIAGYQRHVR